MNIIRLRQKIGELGKSVMDEATAGLMQSEPVFMLGKLHPMTSQELEWCRQNVMDESGKVPTNLPFTRFSATFTCDDYTGNGIHNTAILVFGDGLQFRSRSVGDGKVLQRPNISIHFMFTLDGHEAGIISHFRGEETKGIAAGIYLDGKDITSQIAKASPRAEALATCATGSRTMLLKILFDLMNPANVVLKVTPDGKGRSVQWVQSRTHYCIINKSQAQRCLIEGRGPTDHEIERAAHWRRAHMRRLMSDRFKKKKGQLVFVKQSWIGPEEWQGTDRKIYKVIHIEPPQ